MSAVRQQVNLYQPSAAARAGELAPFGAATALLLTAAVCAGLLGVWGFGLWRVERLEHALQVLRLEQQHQHETLSALGAARAAGVRPEQLDATVKNLTAGLDARARALELLEDGAVGQIAGFSPRLAALARSPIDGLWLDHIVLSGLDGAMSIAGAALDPDLVPRYLKGLAAQRSLVGVRFDDFTIEQPGARASAGKPSSLDSSSVPRFSFRAESGSLRTAQADAHP